MIDMKNRISWLFYNQMDAVLGARASSIPAVLLDSNQSSGRH